MASDEALRLIMREIASPPRPKSDNRGINRDLSNCGRLTDVKRG